MAIISLNPDFDRLNKYFHYWVSKDFHARIEHSSTSKNYDPEWIIPSYESFRNMQIEELTKKAQNVLLDIDMMAYLNLLKKNNLQDYHDDILFVLYQFNKDIPVFQNFFELSGSRDPFLKYYQILKFLKVLSQYFVDGMELIVMVKNKKIKESIHLDNYATIDQVLKTIERLTYNKYFHFIEYDKLDSEDPFPTLNDLSLEHIKSKLKSFKPKKGRRSGLNSHSAIFMKELLNYLNNETHLASEPGTKISNRQGEFLFDLMSIIGLYNYENITDLYKADYIRVIISNYDKALMASFSSK